MEKSRIPHRQQKSSVQQGTAHPGVNPANSAVLSP